VTTAPELDPNKVAAELFHQLIKDTGKLVSTSVRDFFGRVGDVIRKDLQPYFANTIKKCCWVKTLIINREGPTYLFDIYVHTRVSVRSKIVDDDDLIRELPSLKSVVVEGSGGSGKSMFMRYLFVSLCENTFGKLPIFIELRNMNTVSTKDLLAFMYHSITGPGAVLTREQFDSGLKSGSYCIILDGFDEVDVDQRSHIEKQILDLRELFPELVIIVSSRPDPDNRFQSWTKFHVCRVQPMTQKQVTELIEKLDYDSQIKRKFLKSLKDSLFTTHESFLSNPLLCIMMLITFEQHGHIPDKMHIFYEHAFDALFFRHDAAKEGGYRRKTYGDLKIDEFRDCLSAFCIVSYSKERFSFTSAEVRETINKAAALERKEINCADFLSDLVESVCLLQMEGLQYQFTHRSFQEYFAACFIARSPNIPLPSMLDQLCRRRQDDVVSMAFSMNRALLEREWILPKLTKFREMSKGVDPKTNPVRYANELFGGLCLLNRGKSGGDFVYKSPSADGYVWLAINELYADRYRASGSVRRQKDSAVIRDALQALADAGDQRISSVGRRIKSGSIELTEGDNAWLLKTRVPGYFERHKNATLRLLEELKKSAADQKSALEQLF
jgi:NACHT domain